MHHMTVHFNHALLLQKLRAEAYYIPFKTSIGFNVL